MEAVDDQGKVHHWWDSRAVSRGNRQSSAGSGVVSPTEKPSAYVNGNSSQCGITQILFMSRIPITLLVSQVIKRTFQK